MDSHTDYNADPRVVQYYTIIDFNMVDIRIYLPEKDIFTKAARPR